MKQLYMIIGVFIALVAFKKRADFRGKNNFSINIQKPNLVAYITGDSIDIHTKTQAGLLLAGGSTDVDEAMAWMLKRSNGGDIVVLRATGSDGYNEYLYNLVKVNSVETLIIDNREKAFLPEVALKIRNAEAVFIAGGDQWNYVKYWKNSPVQEALNYLINSKKVPIGGTSAGLAILGQAYFSAEFDTVVTDEALQNPYNQKVALGAKDFLDMPFLQNIITDSHYTQRNRQGRHITFMARLMQDHGFKKIRGIGVDEKTAVCINEDGFATVFGKNDAYFLEAKPYQPELCQPNKPLTWSQNQKAIKVFKITAIETGSKPFSIQKWKFKGEKPFYYFVENGNVGTNLLKSQ